MKHQIIIWFAGLLCIRRCENRSPPARFSTHRDQPASWFVTRTDNRVPFLFPFLSLSLSALYYASLIVEMERIFTIDLTIFSLSLGSWFLVLVAISLWRWWSVVVYSYLLIIKYDWLHLFTIDSYSPSPLLLGHVPVNSQSVACDCLMGPAMFYWNESSMWS